jgi:hypothetical protein
MARCKSNPHGLLFLMNIYQKAERITSKWWFYLLIFFVPAILPPFASTGLGYWRELNGFIWYVSDAVYYKKISFQYSMPIMHLAMLLMIFALAILGRRFGRAFSLLVALNYAFIAFAQTLIVTEKYGLVVVSELLAWYLIVLLLWLWEALAPKNDFTWDRSRRKPYWAIPLALIAFWNPDQVWQLHLRFFIDSYSPTAFCMMTPIYLTVLLLFYPKVNLLLLRVQGFIGVVISVITLAVAFMKEPSNGIYWTLLHMPLISISLYSFILGIRTKTTIQNP